MATIHIGLLVALISLLITSCYGQKTTYNMDDRADCNMAGVIDVENDTPLFVNAKQTADAGFASCRIDFQASDVQRLLKIEFLQMYFNGIAPCPVNLYLFYNGITQPTKVLNCVSARPSTDLTKTRTLSARLDKVALDNKEYNFQMVISTYLDAPTGGSNNYGNSPVGAGVIVGIIAGIVVFLIVVFIVVCCCCRRQKGRPYEEAKTQLRDNEPSGHSLSYANENGRSFNNHNAKPKVTSFDGPGGPRTRNVSEYYEDEKPPILDTFESSPTRNQNFKFNNRDANNSVRTQNLHNQTREGGSPTRNKMFGYGEREVEDQWGKKQDEEDEEPPQSPLLVAIRNSARYKTRYNDTEAEAEERRKRFSSHSSAPSTTSNEAGGNPPTPPPPLPVLPRENMLRGPQRPLGPKQASIRRAPPPTSSSEDIEQLGKIHNGHDGDRNIQIIPDSPNEKSHPEGFVAIQTADPHSPLPQRHSFFSSTNEENNEYEEEEFTKPQNNTQHSLRPNRRRSPGAEKRKPPELGGPKKQQKNQQGRHLGQENAVQDRFPQENHEKKKKSQKSPRLGSLRRTRQAASRGDDDDPPPSRPGTPTSVVAKGYRTDDLDEFSPLQRTASRQSLYASRSSLYGRRGKRERASFSESVASYAHDDIDVYRHRHGEDGYEDRPMNKRDRYFKSLGDIHYGGPSREISTQTLRETATQTGSGMVTHSKARRATQRKSPKSQRAQSSSGTQTKDNGKQFEPKVITSRYQKATPKGTKTPKSVETGVGPDDVEHDQPLNGKSKSNAAKREKGTQRPKTPEPIQSAPHQSRAKTPENYTQNQPYHAESPVPSMPGSMAPAVAPQSVPYGVPYEDQSVPFQQQAGVPYQQPGVAYQQQPNVPYHQPGVPFSSQPQPNSFTPPPLPAYSAPPQNVPSPIPYGVPPTSKGPAKSPWELLCDITDAEYQSRPQSRGPASQAGSSYSGVHPKQPFHPGFRQPDRFDQSQHPDRSGPPTRSQTPGAYPTGRATPERRPDSAQSNPPNNAAVVSQPIMYPKKSSWEQLKQLTDSEYKLTYGASNHSPSESNV